MYIGNSDDSSENLARAAVYPYVYRELSSDMVFMGSTPRFIPMYIGNSVTTPSRGKLITVYPYVYRELVQNHVSKVLHCGLSLCI